ncbi:uncharacterized protein LOC101854772 isoform X2 [Aplysia californica]|uniref:Uncharacterized protein LOC101854772 isoform X2 n=1 Tax=Aplysia californica TaxID=6500 RepID=A0ABM0JDD6_APLCA|nr:uncharacterized protein LOC101854772 isoform X2 [Aplysia californica]
MVVLDSMTSRSEAIKLYRPPNECGEERCGTELWEFVYCVAIPGAVLLLILIILSRIMCCSKSCACGKYSSFSGDANDIQMDTYNSIRRASATVRQMSHNRETALLGSRAGSVTLDRSYRRQPRTRDSCHSAPGTLQRQHRRGHAERDNSAEPPAYSSTTEDENGMWRSRQNRYSDQPAPPPPPPYSTLPDDVFLGPDFLGSEDRTQASARYDESPEHNGSGAQPLLPQHYMR